MHLLILTQKVDQDDDVLGFFHRWLTEFAKNCERITVVCLEKGTYDLPENITVLSLGKEEGVSRSKYLGRFYTYVWNERKRYDAVFVHMNYEYVILGGLLWRLLNKKIGLWYAHGHVSVGLRLAQILANMIFTSTKSGFRLPSKKVYVVGQGIDTEHFSPAGTQRHDAVFRIISIGRIAPVKDYETLLGAARILKERGVVPTVTIIGGADTQEQKDYLASLNTFLLKNDLKNVTFAGSIPNKEIVSYLRGSDLFVNTSHTGSLDKAMLEAMSCGIPVLTCNEAMKEVLGEYTDELMFAKKDANALASQIRGQIELGSDDQMALGERLRSIVIARHNIANLIKKILTWYERDGSGC